MPDKKTTPQANKKKRAWEENAAKALRENLRRRKQGETEAEGAPATGRTKKNSGPNDE